MQKKIIFIYIGYAHLVRLIENPSETYVAKKVVLAGLKEKEIEGA